MGIPKERPIWRTAARYWGGCLRYPYKPKIKFLSNGISGELRLYPNRVEFATKKFLIKIPFARIFSLKPVTSITDYDLEEIGFVVHKERKLLQIPFLDSCSVKNYPLFDVGFLLKKHEKWALTLVKKVRETDAGRSLISKYVERTCTSVDLSNIASILMEQLELAFNSNTLKNKNQIPQTLYTFIDLIEDDSWDTKLIKSDLKKVLDDILKIDSILRKKGISLDFRILLDLLYDEAINKFIKNIEHDIGIFSHIISNLYKANTELELKDLIKYFWMYSKKLALYDEFSNLLNSALDANRVSRDILCRMITNIIRKSNIDNIILNNAPDLFDIILSAHSEYELEVFEQNLEKLAPDDDSFEFKPKLELNLDNVSDGYEFEKFLEKLFTANNYKVIRTPFSQDKGADLLLIKNGEVIAVQAKFTKSKIGPKAIQEIVAAINFYNADRGMVVTNSRFTKSAIELASANEVELVDGDKLKEIIENTINKSKSAIQPIELPLQIKDGIDSTSIICVLCGTEMKISLKQISMSSKITCPNCGYEYTVVK